MVFRRGVVGEITARAVSEVKIPPAHYASWVSFLQGNADYDLFVEDSAVDVVPDEPPQSISSHLGVTEHSSANHVSTTYIQGSSVCISSQTE